MTPIICKFWNLWGYKYLEFQTGQFDNANFLSFSFNIKKYTDHPGFCLFVELFYCHFIVTFYDSRHFDEIYPDKIQEIKTVKSKMYKLEPPEK